MTEEFNTTEVEELVTEIEETFDAMMIEMKRPEVKAKARRARKYSLALEKMFKLYRKISIK